MKFTKEMLEKAKTAGNAEELSEMAKAAGIELTAEQAAKAFAELNKHGELSDSELDNVAGGGCDDKSDNKSGDTPKYKVGDKVTYIRISGGAGGIPVGTKVNAEILEVCDKKYGNFYYKVTGGLYKMEQELFD